MALLYNIVVEINEKIIIIIKKREWHDIFKVLKENKTFQRRILYPAKLSFRIGWERKSFPCKQKLKEFITTELALQEIIKELLLAERQGC